MKEKVMDNLANMISNWGQAKGIHLSPAKKQARKLIEEYGEYNRGVNKNDRPLYLDAIGDMGVVCIMLADIIDLDLKNLINPYKWESKEIDEENLNSLISNNTSTILQQSLLLEKLSDTVDVKMAKSQIADELIAMFRNLYILADWHDTSLEICMHDVYLIISKRKGMKFDGIFVKESDFTPEQQAIYNHWITTQIVADVYDSNAITECEPCKIDATVNGREVHQTYDELSNDRSSVVHKSISSSDSSSSSSSSSSTSSYSYDSSSSSSDSSSSYSSDSGSSGF